MYIVDLYRQKSHFNFNFHLFRLLYTNMVIHKKWYYQREFIVITYHNRKSFAKLILLAIFAKKLILVNHNNVEICRWRNTDRLLMLCLSRFRSVLFWNFSELMSIEMSRWGILNYKTMMFKLSHSDFYSLKVRKLYLHNYSFDPSFLRNDFVADKKEDCRIAFQKFLLQFKFVYTEYPKDYCRFSGFAFDCINCGCILVLLKDNNNSVSLKNLYGNRVLLLNNIYELNNL